MKIQRLIFNQESIWIKYVLAFGAGTLLGDAFLHLLPEVMNFHEWPFGVLAGYIFGFVFQKFSPEEDSAKSGAYVNLFANCLGRKTSENNPVFKRISFRQFHTRLSDRRFIRYWDKQGLGNNCHDFGS